MVKYVREELEKRRIYAETAHLNPAGKREGIKYRIIDFLGSTVPGATIASHHVLRDPKFSKIRKDVDPRAVAEYGKLLQQPFRGGGAISGRARSTYTVRATALSPQDVPYRFKLWKSGEPVGREHPQRILTMNGDHGLLEEHPLLITREIMRAARWA